MTAFNVSMLLTANADQAKRELKGASADVQAFGSAARTAGATASAGLKVAEAEIIQLRRSSAGVTSNLVAQFNDVGQMLAAGQSPLLLAAQQGTRISQVLGPLGARGAVAALGEAFLGMLNPVNLMVFAAVAGLGLLGGSLRGLTGETKSVEDAFGDLDTALKTWRTEAGTGIDDLARQFGTVTPAIIEMQRQITDLALTETLIKAADAAQTFGKSLNAGLFDFSTRTQKIAGLLGTDEFTQGVFQSLTPQVEEFQNLLKTVATSENFDEQVAALDRMQAMLVQSAGSYRKMSDEQRSLYQNAVAMERQLRLVHAAEEGIGSAQEVARNRAEQMLATLQDEANVRRQAAINGKDSVQAAEARVAAERRSFEATLAGLDVSDKLKTSLREAWDAANGLQGSGAEAVAALLRAAGAGDETQRAIRDAWDQLTGAADATNVWASAMSGVAAEVRGIGAALGSLGAAGIANASKEIEIEALRSGKTVAEARRVVQEDQIRQEGAAQTLAAQSGLERLEVRLATEEKLRGVALDRTLDKERQAATERDRLANRQSSSGARKTDGGQKLISSLQRELELLKATDPVEKEMIRNREALAKATAAERAEVQQLIAAKQHEEEVQQQVKDMWDFSKQSAFDALDALIVQGESASEVMANLAKSIASALLQSALLGTGPLAGLFGGSGTGLFDIIGTALGIPANADGGLITGPGGPRDDKVLSWLSNGEYVVNADATARHRPLLEAINRAPKYAAGGIVGGGAASIGSGRDQARQSGQPIIIDLRLTDDLDARIASASQDVSVRVMKGGLEEYDAKVLPRRMKAIGADPRRVG